MGTVSFFSNICDMVNVISFFFLLGKTAVNEYTLINLIIITSYIWSRNTCTLQNVLTSCSLASILMGNLFVNLHLFNTLFLGVTRIFFLCF